MNERKVKMHKQTSKAPSEEPQFGSIIFTGPKQTKIPKQYVIVSDKTDEENMKKVYEILMEKWEIKLPDIILSVTGGAKNFKIRKSLTKEFQQSLIKSAIKTGGWIISGGTESGVMKRVGDAVRESSYVDVRKKHAPAVALGIATLGILRDRLVLKQSAKPASNNEEGRQPVKLKVVNHTSLNRNHSHFILVDDGTVDRYGGEITFRAELERYIVDEISKKIPIVCTLLQGGPGSLKTVNCALKKQIPVVVIGDSGGWANIIAAIYSETYNSINENMISGLSSEEGMSYKADELTEWTKWARECMMHKKFITVFSLHCQSAADLDIAILQAILSANSTVGVEATKRHLELALAWNRCDIARTHILTDDAEKYPDMLLPLFIQALKEDKFAFVELFLDEGYDFLNYFSKDHFGDLYEYGAKENNTLANLMKAYDDNSESDRFVKFLDHSMHLPFTPVEDEDEQGILRKLFQWAILLNREEIAKIIWIALSEEEFPAAVAANRLLMKMAEKSNHKEMDQVYTRHAETYKEIALGILTKCYEDNADRTILSLTRKLKNWENATCLQLAVKAECYEFVAHQAVQYHLDKVWLGGIEDRSPQGFWHSLLFRMKLLLCTCLPFLILCRCDWLKIKHEEEESCEEEGKNQSTGRTNYRHQSIVIFHQNKTEVFHPITVWQKFLIFYKAPVVNFIWSVSFYVIFLLLFSYVLLFNLHPFESNASRVPEFLLLFCVTYYMIAKVCLVVNKLYNIWKSKIKKFKWTHFFDFLCLVLFWTGYGFRFTHLQQAKKVLALSFCVCMLRFLNVFKVHKELGPKLLMVGKMLQDLLFFLFIWLVFLLAYGVASQSLLYPKDSRVGDTLIGVLYKPYWQLYGELFLPEINHNPSAGDYACSNNISESIDDVGQPPCPSEEWVVPIMSAIYMILVNVLLLNLLIAMFSYTFEKLVDKTGDIWRFQRFVLIEENYNRPSILCFLSKKLHCLFFCTLRCNKCLTCKINETKANAFVRELKDVMCHECWEHMQTEAYLEERRVKNEDEVSARLENIAITLDSIKKNQKNLEKTLALQPPKKVAKPVHFKARKSPYAYPITQQERFPVEDYMVPWNVPFDNYEPPNYTNEEVLNKPVWADSTENLNIPYNEYDNNNKVDRTSYLGRYVVIDHKKDGEVKERVARNPRGRTGLAGRGVLGRYGPNHAAYCIVSRWKKDDEGFVKRKGKRVLEFIAMKRKDTGKWAIPGVMVWKEKNISDTWAGQFILKILDPTGKANNEFLTFAGTEVHRGYSDDHRNTDNAWIEALVSNFHDERGTFLIGVEDEKAEEVRWTEWHDGRNRDDEKVEIKEKEVELATWIEVGEKSLDLFADHEEFVKKVAEMRNAFH